MENKRICTCCKIIKSFSEFNWDKRFDIPFSRCKDCFNQKCKEYRASKQGQKTYKKWVNSEKGKQVRHDAITKWREKHYRRRDAQTAVSNALRDGKLTKLPCVICGNTKSEAHHPSYARINWLKVVWLCKKHHSEETFKDKSSNHTPRSRIS